MTQNSNLKWRIREYKNKYFVTKKYFNFFWYSFDWGVFGHFFVPIIIFVAILAGLIALPIYFLLEITYTKCFFWTYGSLFVLFLLINRREFESYAEAEAYIKKELEEELKNNVTEISWDGQTISIEKKKE
jgi:hypothetical protein